MGNQGNISRKQGSKMYVFLHISVLSFIFEKKLSLQAEKPLWSAWEVSRALKKLELPSAIALGNSYASFVLVLHNSIVHAKA